MANDGLQDELVLRAQTVRLLFDLDLVDHHKVWETETVGDIYEGVLSLREALGRHSVSLKAYTDHGTLVEVASDVNVTLRLRARGGIPRCRIGS